MTTFLDTNVLIYALDDKDKLHGWATGIIAERRQVGPLIICDVVYSELSVGLDNVEQTDDALGKLAIERVRFSKESLFRARKAFMAYKKNGGPKGNVLPDFFIGAQADTESAPPVTANFGDFSGYFPTLKVISPPKPAS